MTAVDASGSFPSLAAWHELRTRALPRQRRQRMVMAALWIAVIGVLGTNLYILSQRNVTTAVSFDDALRNFRATAGTGAARSSEPTAANLSPFFRPPEGVYSYRTSGGESVSVANASHKYPERTYATIRYLDGCNWEIRNDVIEEHTDRRILCSQYGTLTQLAQERQVEFFGQRDGMEVACKPPALLSRVGEAISTVTTSDCNTDDLSVRVRRAVAGYGDVPIGGRSVPAVHIVIGAKVRYQENATFILESLTPQT